MARAHLTPSHPHLQHRLRAAAAVPHRQLTDPGYGKQLGPGGPIVPVPANGHGVPVSSHTPQPDEQRQRRGGYGLVANPHQRLTPGVPWTEGPGPSAPGRVPGGPA